MSNIIKQVMAQAINFNLVIKVDDKGQLVGLCSGSQKQIDEDTQVDKENHILAGAFSCAKCRQFYGCRVYFKSPNFISNKNIRVVNAENIDVQVQELIVVEDDDNECPVKVQESIIVEDDDDEYPVEYIDEAAYDELMAQHQTKPQPLVVPKLEIPDANIKVEQFGSQLSEMEIEILQNEIAGTSTDALVERLGIDQVQKLQETITLDETSILETLKAEEKLKGDYAELEKQALKEIESLSNDLLRVDNLPKVEFTEEESLIMNKILMEDEPTEYTVEEASGYITVTVANEISKLSQEPMEIEDDDVSDKVQRLPPEQCKANVRTYGQYESNQQSEIESFDNEDIESFAQELNEQPQVNVFKGLSEEEDANCDSDSSTYLPRRSTLDPWWNQPKKLTSKQIPLFHRSEESLKCELCHYVAAFLEHKKRHMFQHGIIGGLCDFCGEGFAYDPDFKGVLQHVQDVHIDGIMQHTCKICLLSFETGKGLKNHALKHNPKLKPRKGPLVGEARKKPASGKYQCDKCSRLFSNISPLASHLAIVHGEGKKSKCTECPYVTNDEKRLKLHFLNVHCDESERPYECTICSKRFSDCPSLNRHILIVHAEPKHECDVCKKKFKLRTELKTHMNIHTGEMPYICRYCGQRFLDRGNKNSHQRKTHKEEDQEYKKKFYVRQRALIQQPEEFAAALEQQSD